MSEQTLREALELAKVAIGDACHATAIYGDDPPKLYRDAMSAIEAALSAPVAQPVADEVAWLVENGKSGNDLRYRTIEQGWPAWTDDHNKAIRFARRLDAEMFAAEDEDAWRIVEHMWQGGTLAATEPKP